MLRIGRPIPRVSRSNRGSIRRRWRRASRRGREFSSGSFSPQVFTTGVWATFGTSSFQNPSSPGATSNPAAIEIGAGHAVGVVERDEPRGEAALRVAERIDAVGAPRAPAVRRRRGSRGAPPRTAAWRRCSSARTRATRSGTRGPASRASAPSGAPTPRPACPRDGARRRAAMRGPAGSPRGQSTTPGGKGRRRCRRRKPGARPPAG